MLPLYHDDKVTLSKATKALKSPSHHPLRKIFLFIIIFAAFTSITLFMAFYSSLDNTTPEFQPSTPDIKDPIIDPINYNTSQETVIHVSPNSYEQENDPEARDRAEAVKEAMKHAWNGYEKICFGQDELIPIAKKCENWLNQGLTIVDSLDTLWLMGMKSEFTKARDWVADNLIFEGTVSFFETTIRELGGLLSAYDLSKDKIFLEKAEILGDRLLGAFDSSSGIPFSRVNLLSRVGGGSWSGKNSILAEIGTVQMEFVYLSHHTGNPIYKETAMKVFSILNKLEKPYTGLYPIYINTKNPNFSGGKISFGAMGDSFYEYLLKVWVLNDKKEDWLLTMYHESMEGMFEYLVKRTKSDPSYTYLADFNNGNYDHKMDHLACFASGMLALGVLSGASDKSSKWISKESILNGDLPKDKISQQHLRVAEELGETCFQMYNSMGSGVAPEFVTFSEKGIRAGNANMYILRPEAIEAMFYLWRVTKNQKWRDYGWKIFSNINKQCKAENGYASLRKVSTLNPEKYGTMQSFFLAETLKYAFLLFSPDSVIPLNEYVFNTEAHPLSIIYNQ